ncbi:MAG: FHA domain-containing protein [Candidatus Eremiobacteraeota bacterium]|nr:FHA domain-containing protein [Candidatus Eremiobacteraeota bacterium]
MNFLAHMRLGSVEVLGALAVFVTLAGRANARNSVLEPSDARQRVALEVNERSSVRRVDGYCPFTIGRASGADVVLNDPAVSRVHARLDNEAQTVFLTDLSSNGTYLNGERITDSLELRTGDTIDIGLARITYLGAPHT